MSDHADPAAPAPAPKAPSRLAWFFFGALAASAAILGYQQMQRMLVQKIMSGMGLQAAPTAGEPSLDAQAAGFLQQAQQTLQTLQPAAQGSSLDLVSGPGGAPARAGGPAAAVPVTPQQAAQQGANLLSSVMPLLSNPALTRGMTPDQQKQMQQLVGTIGQLQGSLQSGQPMTAAQQQAMLQTVQQAMRGMPMQATPATPTQHAAPAARDGQTR
jgi:hypothetical protein